MIDRRDFLVRSAGIALGSVATVRCAGQPVTPAAQPVAGQVQGPGSFDLEVAITGLCVFVPDPTSPTMHVLMVAPVSDNGGDGHGGVRHYPRVFYDAAHDSSITPGGFWRVVPLEDTVLDLSSFGGNGGLGRKLGDIPGLVDISPYTPALSDPTATDLPRLGCRLTLPLADAIDCPDPKGDWVLRQQGQPDIVVKQAAWKVVWKMAGIPAPELSLQLQPFPRTPAIPDLQLAPLRPIKDGNRWVVRLFISNAIREESGPPLGVGLVQPKANFEMPHFGAFRDLYEGSPVAEPWPQLLYQGPAGASNATPYTCLPSGGH